VDLEPQHAVAGDLGNWIAGNIEGTETWVVAELPDIAILRWAGHEHHQAEQ
jgi:hypothetical protein